MMMSGVMVMNIAKSICKVRRLLRMSAVVVDKKWNERLMLMPIPTTAIDVNPLLKEDQNPGY